MKIWYGCDSMASKGVVLTAEKIKNRKKRMIKVRIILVILLILLMCLFLVLSLAYNGGSFTVTLDPNLNTKSGLVIYDDPDVSEYEDDARKLFAQELTFMDNISIDWIPKDIDQYKGGGHNGDNYIAYTFYLENKGSNVIDYWYQMYIDDVIKNVDDAVRVMVILNGKRTVYAKVNALTNQPEKGTVAFYEPERPVLENRASFAPGEVDKFTIVIWLEGDDPECVDNILGGEIKMHMEITEEHTHIHSPNQDDNTNKENNENNK